MERRDPHQERARELCLADGIDPDSRIERPGLRSMPAWVPYREVAIDEAKRAKIEAAAEAVAALEQPERYRDAPLTGVGQHDEQTVAQMRNCMGVGNVIAGVICADGHVGYAQPVGGVIALEGQISISGVGFDIGCVDAETEFLSPNGWVRMDLWDNHLVAQYEPFSNRAIFVEPLDYIRKPATSFLHFKTKFGIDQMLSPDHRMLVYAPGPGRAFAHWSVKTAAEIAERHAATVQGHDYRINTTFRIERESGLDLSDEEIGVVIMTCADAHLEHREGKKTGTAILSLKKQRKIERARELLTLADVEFHESGPDTAGYTHFRYRPPILTKSLAILWDAGPAQLAIIAEEVLHWDGNAEDRAYYSRDRASADFVHYVFAATGRRSVMREDIRESGIDYRVFAQINTKVGIKSVPKTPIREIPAQPGQEQFCFTVPSGFFVIRRGGNIALTGNCGNMAVKLDTTYAEIADRVGPILSDIGQVISFGVGRNNAERVVHDLLDDSEAWKASDMDDYRQKAAGQLGTVGSGNHYVDLLRDETDHVWIGVHFGSRGLGHTSATKYLRAAGGTDGMHVPPAVVDEDSELGQRYIAAMELAGRYAYAGREWVVERVRRIIGGLVLDSVHNHHNYAWREVHNGRSVWVVRKGATPAFPGQRGFVGGSMGDEAVILEGVDSEQSRANLYSTVHGAGRLYSRTKALKTFTHAEMHEWLQRQGVMLLGADLDESPMAYRRLPEVLAAHAGTVKVQHRLRPFAVAMAGKKVVDPFKD